METTREAMAATTETRTADAGEVSGTSAAEVLSTQASPAPAWETATAQERATVEEQLRIIKKGTLQVIQEGELREKLVRALQTGKPLVIKLGLDPSAPDIHLGHTVVLRKVRQLQDMGHRAVIIIGDFTGKIGDPTGRSKTRKPLSEEQVKENAHTYLEQIFKVLDQEKTEVRFNGEWLAQLDFASVIRLAATTTVARLLERDDFSGRYRRQEPIGLHEFFYPLMQAYDSVQIKADIELGGTDQTFNVLMGRSLQREWGLPQQIAIFMPILEGLDGVEKMSKSLNNYIGVSESPEVMFKKVMEVPDALIIRYFELATDEHPDRIAALTEALAAGENPRNVKLLLAELLVRLYHGETAAQEARTYFDTVFSRGELPEQMPELWLEQGQQNLLDIAQELVRLELVKSASELRRLIAQGGVQCNGERVTAPETAFSAQETVLRIGKKKFLRLIKRQ